MTDDLKSCFIICPIGSPGSPPRLRSDGVFREILFPVLNAAGYDPTRADHDKGPGIVTDGIVRKVLDADLVVADLHGHNANVMYEVALRHAADKPIIQMIEDGEKLPFDIGGLNTIFYVNEAHAFEKWRGDLRAAVEAVERGDHGSNPVARAARYRGLETSGSSTDQTLREILRELQILRHPPRPSGFSIGLPEPPFFEKLSDHIRSHARGDVSIHVDGYGLHLNGAEQGVGVVIPLEELPLTGRGSNTLLKYLRVRYPELFEDPGTPLPWGLGHPVRTIQTVEDDP